MPPLAKKQQLAINLADLDRLGPTARQKVAKHLNPKAPVRIDPDDLEEVAVPFVGDLLSAACICDILRSHDREAGDVPTRVYAKNGGGWESIRGNVALVIMQQGVATLNPLVFPGADGAWSKFQAGSIDLEDF